MMKTYSVIGVRIRSADAELLQTPASNDCPPHSTCAQAAVETVRRRLLEKKRQGITLSKARFVHKTGFTE